MNELKKGEKAKESVTAKDLISLVDDIEKNERPDPRKAPFLLIKVKDCGCVYRYYKKTEIPSSSVTCPCGNAVITYEG